nr:hypothetical protein [Moraxella caviae]
MSLSVRQLVRLANFGKATDGGWYIPNGLLLLPPSSFFIIAGFIAIIRLWKKTNKSLLNL